MLNISNGILKSLQGRYINVCEKTENFQTKWPIIKMIHFFWIKANTGFKKDLTSYDEKR